MAGTPGAIASRQQSADDRAANQDHAAGRPRAKPFDADARRKTREDTPVVVAGLTFKRRRKAWAVTRAMRALMREQEAAVARATRVTARTAELEAEQIEAAAKGESEREEELERTIVGLVKSSDASREEAELATYRLIALLLVPPPAEDSDDVPPRPAVAGFGPVDDPSDAQPALELLLNELDAEDAFDLAQELSGEAEPDPQKTPSSETGLT